MTSRYGLTCRPMPTSIQLCIFSGWCAKSDPCIKGHLMRSGVHYATVANVTPSLIVNSSKKTQVYTNSDSDNDSDSSATKRSPKLTERTTYKPVGDKTPRLAQISLPWQQGSAPQHCTWFHWIGHPPENPLVGANISDLSVNTSRVIGDFVQVRIWGSKFWALGGLNQKSKKKLW